MPFCFYFYLFIWGGEWGLSTLSGISIIFIHSERASLSRIFFAANQPLSYSCKNNTGLDKANSQRVIDANQLSAKYRLGEEKLVYSVQLTTCMLNLSHRFVSNAGGGYGFWSRLHI